MKRTPLNVVDSVYFKGPLEGIEQERYFVACSSFASIPLPWYNGIIGKLDFRIRYRFVFSYTIS